MTTTTENGDTAFQTTGSFCLDFYALAGGMRYNYKDLNNLFIRSYYEDKKITLKIMLYLRDILDGMGERNSFRMTFNLLSNLYPNLARQLLPLISKYGRWDDILAGINTPIEEDVMKLIKKTLKADLKKYDNNKEISLLSKWLPSINTSNKGARKMANKIATKLGYTNEEYRKSLLNENRYQDVYWKAIERKEFATKAIVVRDGSSSMLWGGNGSYTPMQIATSLAIFAAEQLPYPFKNHFITFSENPRLIEIPEGTIEQKVRYVESFGECANTDISKVYELLLNVAKSKQVKPEDMVEQVIVISDMEFDYCVGGKSTFETYKEKFAELGLEMPQLVFWNIEARSIHTPVTENELGVKLVSGSSQKILDRVVSNKINCTPYEFMIEDLARYSEVDSFKL